MKNVSAQFFSKIACIVLLENFRTKFFTYILFFFLFSNFTFGQTTITISPTGSGTFSVPCDVTSLTVEAWGGGGAGGGATANRSKGGAGGAGGTYALSVLTVTPGQIISYNVGAGANGASSAGAAGEASWFITNGTLYAQGGAGGAAPNDGTVLGGVGSIASSIGTTRIAGVNGANGTTTIGGAGGDGANSGGAGGNQTDRGDGDNGAQPGGGGGGAFVDNNSDRIGGNGGNGQIKITYTNSLQTYCVTGYSSGTEAITNVTFAGINNTTGANATGGNHEYFCDTASVMQSGSYTISVNGDTEGNKQHGVIAYFDWNQNGVFTDAGEDYQIGVLLNNNGNGTPVTATITVPSGATIGTTTMRVMKMYNAYPGSCYNFTGSGQTEDYLVSVTALTGYCQPSTVSADVCYIDDVQFVGTLNDVSKLNSSYGSNDGYQDWTSEPKAIQAQGEGINIIADAGGTRGGWKAWVDWNKNDQFEVGEEVYNPGASLGSTGVFGFVIPDNQTPGDYRLRIRVGVNYWNWNGNGFFEYPDEEFYYDFNSCEDFINSSYQGQANYYFGEAEDYLFTVIEKCDSYVASVTDGEACGLNQTVDLSFIGTGGTTVTGFNIYTNETGGSPLTPAPSISGLTGSWTTPAISTTTTYWVTATSACANGESLVRVAVTAYILPIPILSFSPSSPIVCGEDAIVEISALGDKETVYLIDEDFESGLGVFANINNDTNTAAVNNITQWQVETSTHNNFAGGVWSPAISSGINNNQFALATSDHINASTASAKPVDNSITLATGVNTTDFTSLELTFDLFYLRYFSDNYINPSLEEYVDIDISTDNGGTWTTLERLEEDLGYGSNFINKTYDLFALGYNDFTQLKIRVRHYSWADDSSGFGWLPDGIAIDNVKLFGEKPLNTAFDWNITADAYTDPGATTAYVSGTSAPVSTIYVKPLPSELQSSTSFTFTATAILSNGCSASTDIIITNNTKYLKDPAPEEDWEDPNNWLPGGVPTADNCVIISDTCMLPEDGGNPTGYNAYAKNLTIRGTGNLEILRENNLTVTDWIDIKPGGVLDIRSSANLIQVTDVAVNGNIGDINMERTVTGLSSNGTDYVYWSSPVDQFNVQDISSATTTEAIYKWIPTIGNNYGNWQSVIGNMPVGKGYIVRDLQTTSPVNTAKFTGVPNNGVLSVPIERGTYVGADYTNPINGIDVTAEDDNWNLIGNPYPSSILANEFIYVNADPTNGTINGTIYLWTHVSDPSTAEDDPFYDDFVYNYNADDYIEVNYTGTNPPSPPGIGDFTIASGQAFFVLMLDNASSTESVTFNNSMRNERYDNTNFYGPNLENGESEINREVTEKHRIWLDLITSNDLAASILVGYIEGATDNKDNLYDGYEFSGSALSFYSLIEDDKMSIQGKALPFNSEDRVPLGLVVPNNGNYKIAINTLDGLFEDESQNIYLEDTYTNTIHNLRISPYSFNAVKGTFDDRFILRYTDESLSTNSNNIDSIRLYYLQDTQEIYINWVNSYDIKEVKLINILGQEVKQWDNIEPLNQHEIKIPTKNISDGNYIIKVINKHGKTSNKKVIIKQ